MTNPAAARSEIEQAASRNGFPAEAVVEGEWLRLRSPWTRHEVLAGHDGARFLLAVRSATIVRELQEEGVTAVDPAPAGVLACFAAADEPRLHALLQRIYQLARSLPPEPLVAFEARTRDLPRTTEAERLVVQRIGQDVFRESLMEYWGGLCPLTGIADSALLRASHIVPWKECESDAERLDVHNGLLLSALWDAAFDRALVSFDDDGCVLVGADLSACARAALACDDAPRLRLSDRHRARLARHRARLRGADVSAE
ncbi:MAG: HNH endonuclease [Salinarimonadaceae bacterium]|nr:MAG: HNH endonuclease [Salinarimonadaceae bacterium]